MKLAATTVAFNDKNEVLLGLRKDTNMWTIPGGGVEANELPEDAAVREMREETGIQVSRHDLHYLGSDLYLEGEGVALSYLLEPTLEVEPLLLEPELFIEWRWMPLSEALRQELFGCTRPALEAVTTVHHVFGGSTLCGMLMPSNVWRRGHIWSDAVADITCRACRKAHETMARVHQLRLDDKALHAMRREGLIVAKTQRKIADGDFLQVGGQNLARSERLVVVRGVLEHGDSLVLRVEPAKAHEERLVASGWLDREKS